MRKPLRQNVALAIDGGGIKGVMVARALMRLEEELGGPLHERVNLTAVHRPVRSSPRHWRVVFPPRRFMICM